MATSRTTIDFLMDQLQGLDALRSVPMFGEYALYAQGKVFAFVCDDTLFIKPTEAGRAFLGQVDEAPAYPGSRLYYRITADDWDDREWLAALVRVTVAALPEPKPKRPRTPRSRT